MVSRDVRSLGEAQAVELGGEAEYGVDAVLELEVRLEGLVAYRVLGGLVFFRPVTEIPGLEFAALVTVLAGEGEHLRDLLARGRE